LEWRRCRGPHLRLLQWPRRQRGKFIRISLPFTCSIDGAWPWA
jgi:hypothetical protein